LSAYLSLINNNLEKDRDYKRLNTI
jgi:hypothetical protein